jgi:hypothetical protein
MQHNFIESYSIFGKDFCNKLIDCYEEAEAHGITHGRQAKKLEIEDTAVHLPNYGLPLKHTTADLFGTFNAGLEVALNQYYDKYGALQNVQELKNYKGKIQKTEPGQGFHVWHCENNSASTMERQLTWTVYLNDEFEAGETEFLYQQYRYKPKMGDVVIFPTAFTHTHRGNPPINGTKYIMTGWLEY